MDLRSISDRLEWEEGVWVSKGKAAVSYPEEGHEGCFQLEENSFWYRHRGNCIIEAINQYPPRGAIFDVGGGNGVVAKAIEEKGYETVLVEPGETGAGNAQKRGLTHIVRSTLEEAGFRAGTLPAVGLFDVLEHIRDRRDFLETVYRLLEPGGKLYITVPALGSLWSAEDDFAGHFKRFTVKTISKELKDLGFHVEYATYMFSFLPPAIFLSRSLPYRLGWAKKDDWRKRYRNEHTPPNTFLAKLLEKACNVELKRIRRRKPIPWGSSCLVVAAHPGADRQVLRGSKIS